MKTSRHFGLLLFPGVTQLDLTGPAEVFGSVPDAQLHLIWKDRVPVATGHGWRIEPTTTFADCPQLDVLCVPGGSGQIALMDDEETLDFLRRQAQGARYVTSVCTGSLVLAAAGLLRGYRAACHWMSRDQLALLGAIPDARRIVMDRNRITGGGVTAGIDFGLFLVALLCGEDVARGIALAIEYDPHPPFEAGVPEHAGEALVRRVEQDAERRQALRMAATLRAAKRLGL
ncbi:DJ-1/PfpI family protein [Paludibacterium paludis]|uniref:Dimethylglycine dehydrogenase n=1 Tax=Paludibacterium paludis TaxID=1225769 RepID=A0A918UB11_9NEIS|nr:DJ-1/PfpI family protein [Paludibacterium paludis]GGY26043.1 dimethylglycine dehydrogenase [Paludibacterium paludis]